jgi:2-(1,2-epoxy-1,2-dihydrophenyl)acetyl-CoA isomerase
MNTADRPHVLLDVDGGVLVITFNRPETLNAWNYGIHTELRRAIEAANANPDIDAIVVTGSGKGFCAGADMSAVFGLSEAQKQAARAEARTHEWVRLARSSKPLIAAVNGAAFGVGITLILPMDQILASSEAKFGLSFVRMGIVPEFAGSHWLQRRLNFGTANRLLLTGESFLAEEALAMGLIDHVTPADSLLDEARALARRMGQNPHAALRETKQLLTQNACEGDVDLVQQRELDALARCYASPEHHEAVAAFKAKRAPDFRSVRH